MTLERLRKALGNLHDTKGVLAVLGDQPIPQKRDELYPELPAFVAELLCGAAVDARSLRALLRFYAIECGREPALAGKLYAAIGDTPVRFERGMLFEVFIALRDRDAIPLLRGGAQHAQWADAVIALNADDLLDEVLEALAAAPTRELAVACGYVGRERARDALTSGPGDAVHPIGLAILANPDDKAYLAQGMTPNRTTARRIHTALTARGPKQRIEALGDLGKGLASTTEPGGVERLMACTLALADKRADVVEHAAAILALHAKAQRNKLRPAFFPAFLERAAGAVAGGVTEATRAYFEIVRAQIPRAPDLGAATVVAPPPTRKAAAKAKGQEMLEAMPVRAERSNQRDAGIEAQIAADPDATAAYLVYADWLQTQSDARGTWITLHTVKGLAAREAIDAFLREHRESLVGPLRELVVEDGPVELEWFMGFVRRARFTAAATVDVVRAVLDATCGAFVQELVFPDDALATPVTALLLERQPQTIKRLAFGAHDEAPDALVTVMPRLRRDPAVKWREALARLGELRRVRPEIEAEEVPTLVCVRGVTIDVDPADILHGLKQEFQLERPIGLAAAMSHVFTPASLDAYAARLGEIWLEDGRADSLGWAIAATSTLGGARTARVLGEGLDQLVRSRARLGAAFEHLRAIGTPAALEEIVQAAFGPAQDHRVRALARSALAEQFPAELDGAIACAAPSGDARSLQVQRTWLESMMVDGRSLVLAEFRRMLAIPARLAAAQTLLWAARHGDTLAGMFRVDDSGALVRRDGSHYQPDGRIGLVHPAELSESELAEAQEMFAGVEQAIAQVERPTFAISVDEASTDELERFVRRRVGFQPIATALRERGWSVAFSDTVDDDGEERWVGTGGFERAFPRDGLEAVATLNDTRGSIEVVRLHRGVQTCTFDQAHVVTISELLWDLETAHGWRPGSSAAPSTGRGRVRAEPAAPAARGGAPVVERAKSGRSKCVVCEQAIAKHAMRIGIERMIETPAFRGRATVWLHPACRADVPELDGVELEGAD